MPRVPPEYIKKSFTHKSILVSLPIELIDIVSSIIPNYKRSQLIKTLLEEWVGQHGQDPVLDINRSSQKKSKKK